MSYGDCYECDSTLRNGEGLCHECVGPLRARVAELETALERLRTERNGRVASTKLGMLSEELEMDNWGSAATLVRSAMHEQEDLRARVASLENFLDSLSSALDEPVPKLAAMCRDARAGRLIVTGRAPNESVASGEKRGT